jgi:4-hydroxy-tetrahydrodipicolinate synthase
MTFPEGVYTVLVTPFSNDNEIDYDDLDKLIDVQLNSNISGLVLLGTTSESPTISLEEKKVMVNYVYNSIRTSNYGNNKFIVVGVGGNDTRATSEFAKYCYDNDLCDGFLVTVPNYNKPSQEGVYRHFVEIANTVPNKPIMMYNIPSRTGINMLVDTMKRVANTCPNICAVKESTGDLNQAQDILHTTNIQVFSGDDALTVPIMSIGGSGVISVAGSVIPGEVSDVVLSCLKGDYDTASKKHYNMREFLKYLFVETNPGPIKEVLFKSNVFKSNNMRLPMLPVQSVEVSDKLMELYGVAKFDL